MQEMSERKAKEKAKERDNWECRFCGVTNEQHKQEYERGLHAHHIVPSSNGGADSPENLITVCEGCHKTLEHTQAKALGRIREERVDTVVKEAKADAEVRIKQLERKNTDLVRALHELARATRNMDWLVDELSNQSVYFDAVNEWFGTRLFVTSDREKAIDSFEDWGSSLSKEQVYISQDCAERIVDDLENTLPTKVKREMQR